ncbi:MAG: phosphoribulokinase [Pseudomonadota bacterium]
MREILRHPLFWLGLLIRVAISPFFGSYYLSDLFIPFLDHAVLNPTMNPWSALTKASFPYGGFLFGVLWLPRFLLYKIFGVSVLGAGPIGIALTKLPLVGFEIVLLTFMNKVGSSFRRIAIFYWLSPIAIYVTYIHGQLDIVMVTAVFISFSLLQNRRIVPSAIVMACAMGAKFSAALMIPLALGYIWHREFAPRSWRFTLTWLGLCATLSCVFFLPLISAQSLTYATVGSPEALRLLAARIDLGLNSYLYLGPALVAGVLSWLCLGSRMSGEGLIMAGGFVFGALLVTTQSMPGWYLWALPMLAMLYIRYPSTPALPWYGFNALYIMVFAALPSGIMGNSESQIPWSQIFFTLLQTNLALILGMIWYIALRHEVQTQQLLRPVVIGIAGDSGVGKDRLSKILVDSFSDKHTTVIHGDDYHKWERGDAHYQRVTHLHPEANHLKTMGTDARSLIKGRMIKVRHYDHHSGRFTSPHDLKSERTLIVQGLHTLYLRGMRRNFDIRVFLAPHEILQMAWKIRRDVKERGAEIKKVVKSIEDRKLDAARHISPQRSYADWIIEASPRANFSMDDLIKGLDPPFYVRHIVWNDIDLEPLTESIKNIGKVSAVIETMPHDLDRTVLTVDGDLSARAIQDIGDHLFPNLRYITRSPVAPLWRGGYDGLAQLLAFTLLQERLERRYEASDDDFYQTPRQSDQRAQHLDAVVGS